MKNVLDVPVSLFENCTSPRNPQEINLWEWLHSDTHRADIERLRTFTEKAERDRIKRSLPGITPSGLFSYRKKDGLIRHSGLICIDIDAKRESGDHRLRRVETTPCPNAEHRLLLPECQRAQERIVLPDSDLQPGKA